MLQAWVCSCFTDEFFFWKCYMVNVRQEAFSGERSQNLDKTVAAFYPKLQQIKQTAMAVLQNMPTPPTKTASHTRKCDLG